jgi:hypothetical protein
VARASVELGGPGGERVIARHDTVVVLGADGSPIGLELTRDREHARARVRAGWIPLTETREPRALFEMGGATHPIRPCGATPAPEVYFAGDLLCLEDTVIEVDGRTLSAVELIPHASTYKATLAERARVSGRDLAPGTRIVIGDAGGLRSASVVEPMEVAGLTVPVGSIVNFGGELSIQLLERPMSAGGYVFRPGVTLITTPKGRLRRAVFATRQVLRGRVFPDAGDGIWQVEFTPRGRIAALDCVRC